MVDSIEKALSSEAVYGRLQGLRWLAEAVGGRPEHWLSLTPSVINRVVKKMQARHSPSTVYARANAIGVFINYLNATRVGSGDEATTLLGRHVRWRSKLQNPIRRSIEIGVDGIDKRGERKYVPMLHKSLGEARSRIKKDPSLELSPGYDLIRLESLAFAMATGMRIGELCALSVRCFDTHEATGTRIVRVATEKGQPAAARPIADVWVPAVSDAYDYLLERCSEARARAREIDLRGFVFVRESLAQSRQLRPAGQALQSQLEALGLDVGRHFQIEEVVRVFDLTEKEFAAGGRFYDCTVQLPKVVAARVVNWLDRRVDAWDWHLHSSFRLDNRTGQVGSRSLSAKRISQCVGGGESCLPKAGWFYAQLRAFLIELSRSGALEGRPVSRTRQNKLRCLWQEVRERALANKGGAMCTAVDIDAFVAALAARYKAHLQQHYGEIVSFDDEGVPIPGNGIRPGVPSRLGDHLIVLWEGEFSGIRSKGILPRPIFRSDYYNYLSANAQKRTVFERIGIVDAQGKAFSISPHQIRHWVTTAIFRSGPSEMMVDLWMGRTAGQSRTYDHRTAHERAETLRERYLVEDPPNDYLGRQVRLWKAKGISSDLLEEHVKSKLRVLHFVPTGGCSRELFLSPCSKGLMCLRGFGTGSACPSFHIDTRDGAAKAQIISLRDQYRAMLMALYPTLTILEEAFADELNSSEVLDQHIHHIREVLRGCEQALLAYGESSSEGVKAVIDLEVLV